MTQFVYRFGDGSADGNKDLKTLLGGKGANLAEMAAAGLPVPPGFTITTEACKTVLQGDGTWPDGLANAANLGLAYIEAAMGLMLGDPENPLLGSVRSGAAVSMPGMMDTVLNLGLNDEVVEGLARKMNNERFALDAYRRFIDMFGDVVMGVHHGRFEEALAALKSEHGISDDVDLDADALRTLVGKYKTIYEEQTGETFPSVPRSYLCCVICAV